MSTGSVGYNGLAWRNAKQVWNPIPHVCPCVPNTDSKVRAKNEVARDEFVEERVDIFHPMRLRHVSGDHAMQLVLLDARDKKSATTLALFPAPWRTSLPTM